MLGLTYLDFIRYFYCTCLTRPPDFLSRFRNLAGAMQRTKIDKIERQVAPVEEAGKTQQILPNRLPQRFNVKDKFTSTQEHL